jgi:hypothetical protein
MALKISPADTAAIPSQETLPLSDESSVAKASSLLIETTGKLMKVGAWGVGLYALTFLNPVSLAISIFEQAAKIAIDPWMTPLSKIESIAKIIFGSSSPTAYSSARTFVQSHPFISALCLNWSGNALIETAEKTWQPKQNNI